MIVQVGPTCSTGNFSITTVGGTWNGPAVSSPNPDFTVVAANIYYVATKGSNSNKGNFQHPWATVPFAVQTAGAGTGNVIYAENGVQVAVDDGQGWGAALTIRDEWSHGTAFAPNALIAYPGASVQIGCIVAGCTPNFGVRSTEYSTSPARGFWTFAGINFRSGSAGAVDVNGGTMVQTSCTAWNGGKAGCESRGWRFVGNDVSNANSSTETAFQFTLAIQSKVFGNYLHDLILNSNSRLDQALYMSTDANNNEIGWNEIYNNKGRGGLQTHSSNLCVPSCGDDQTGFILHDLSIHDNKIHHINEEGILLDTIDPSQGSGVKVYNNVVYDAGLDGNGDSAHFQLSGDFNQGKGIGASPPPAWWYNNTVYTANGEAVYGNWWPDIHSSGQTLASRVSNNILYSASTSIPYLHVENYHGGCANTDKFSLCGTNSGSNNIMYGDGVPTFGNLFTNSLNVNPLFVSPSSFDFHLQSGSPATGAGLQAITDVTGKFSVSAPLYDIDGRIRPNPPSIGAYEFGTAR